VTRYRAALETDLGTPSTHSTLPLAAHGNSDRTQTSKKNFLQAIVTQPLSLCHHRAGRQQPLSKMAQREPFGSLGIVLSIGGRTCFSIGRQGRHAKVLHDVSIRHRRARNLPQLNAFRSAEKIPNHLIMPEPTAFLSRKLPPVSIIRRPKPRRCHERMLTRTPLSSPSKRFSIHATLAIEAVWRCASSGSFFPRALRPELRPRARILRIITLATDISEVRWTHQLEGLFQTHASLVIFGSLCRFGPKASRTAKGIGESIAFKSAMKELILPKTQHPKNVTVRTPPFCEEISPWFVDASLRHNDRYDKPERNDF